MGSSNIIRATFVGVLIILSVYGLLPTINYYNMSIEERAEKQRTLDPDYLELKQNILNLGLDLQGGMHVVVEIDVEKYLIRTARKTDAILEAAALAASNDELNTIKTLQSSLIAQGKKLTDYFGNRKSQSEDTDEELLPLLQENIDNAVDRALEIIRNRIDQFGVSEPSIQKQGNRRIIVEVAGDVDPDRIRKTIFTEARLEFKLMPSDEKKAELFKAVNEYYRLKYDIKDDEPDTAKVDSADTNKDKLADLLGDTETKTDSVKTENKRDPYILLPIRQDIAHTFIVKGTMKEVMDTLMLDPEFKKHLIRTVGPYMLHYKKTRTENGRTPEFYYATFSDIKTSMEGDGIRDAKWGMDPTAIDEFGYLVTLKFSDRASYKFSNLSKNYQGEQMAIILDGVIQSDPKFNEPIPVGSGAQISGSMDQQEASDLAIVLKSGSLPAPLKMILEETVGASLGQESVNAGMYSTVLGIILVLVFMVGYYKKGGFIASLAVIVNMLMITATLAAFGGVLTLPGIAGIILTIGMSVDANVLIFERIREEIADGVRVFSALQNGYSKAIVAILDANITTFIAGVVLYSFGTGTIRGFALTLMIGILTSLITAVIMTRVIFEVTTKPEDQTISI